MYMHIFKKCHIILRRIPTRVETGSGHLGHPANHFHIIYNYEFQIIFSVTHWDNINTTRTSLISKNQALQILHQHNAYKIIMDKKPNELQLKRKF